MKQKTSVKNLEIEKLKQTFLKKRNVIKKRFYLEKKAIKTCKKISQITDEFLISIFNFYAKENKEISEMISVCAVGGFGRKVLAPFSDLDILILYSNSTDLKKIDKFIRFFIYPLWDLNLKVGYAVRSENQAIELSTKDHVIKTSMLDSRIICGSQIIYEKTINKFF